MSLSTIKRSLEKSLEMYDRGIQSEMDMSSIAILVSQTRKELETTQLDKLDARFLRPELKRLDEICEDIDDKISQKNEWYKANSSILDSEELINFDDRYQKFFNNVLIPAAKTRIYHFEIGKRTEQARIKLDYIEIVNEILNNFPKYTKDAFIELFSNVRQIKKELKSNQFFTNSDKRRLEFVESEIKYTKDNFTWIQQTRTALLDDIQTPGDPKKYDFLSSRIYFTNLVDDYRDACAQPSTGDLTKRIDHIEVNHKKEIAELKRKIDPPSEYTFDFPSYLQAVGSPKGSDGMRMYNILSGQEGGFTWDEKLEQLSDLIERIASPSGVEIPYLSKVYTGLQNSFFNGDLRAFLDEKPGFESSAASVISKIEKYIVKSPQYSTA